MARIQSEHGPPLAHAPSRENDDNRVIIINISREISRYFLVFASPFLKSNNSRPCRVRYMTITFPKPGAVSVNRQRTAAIVVGAVAFRRPGAVPARITAGTRTAEV